MRATQERYLDYLASDHWGELRARKLAQQPRCHCGKTTNLEVHHIRYRREGWHHTQLCDLVVLCRKHHEIVHGFRSKFKRVNLKIPDKARQAIKRQSREKKRYGNRVANDMRRARYDAGIKY